MCILYYIICYNIYSFIKILIFSQYVVYIVDHWFIKKILSGINVMSGAIVQI